MNFSCDNCQRRYSIADEKVRGKTVKVRCKNCQNVISVQGPPMEMEESTRVVSLADVERIREQERAMAAAASAPAATAAPSGASPWEDEPTRAAPARQAAAPWFVMVKSKQEGPLDEAGLQALMESGAVNARSFFWQQGMADWKRGSDIPELAGLFAHFLGFHTFFKHQLGEAVPVAQVNPEYRAFVAGELHPAAKGNGLANVLGAEFAAGVGS